MGRIPTGAVPEQALQFIRSRHRQIMYRLIQGQTQAHIARDLDMDQSRMSVIVNSPLFKGELRKMEDKVFQNLKETRGDISVRVKELQPQALDVIEGLMTSTKTGAKLKRECAKDILDLDKRRRTDEEDGSTPFAQMINEAFKIAKQRHEDGQVAELEPTSLNPKERVEKNVTPGYHEAIETSAVEVGEETPYAKAEKTATKKEAVEDSSEEDDGDFLMNILDACGVET